MLAIVEECHTDRWVCEIQKRAAKESDEHDGDERLTGEEGEGPAWDHVNLKDLGPTKVQRARGEEIGDTVQRGIWKVCQTKECWAKLGEAPVRARREVTLKANEIRSRLVARGFKEATKIGLMCARPTRF